MEYGLRGSRALVTGASRRLGRAISDRASHISGTVITIDGGQALRSPKL